MKTIKSEGEVTAVLSQAELNKLEAAGDILYQLGRHDIKAQAVGKVLDSIMERMGVDRTLKCVSKSMGVDRTLKCVSKSDVEDASEGAKKKEAAPEQSSDG